MKFESWFSSEYPEIPGASAAAVLALHAEGSTIPFIARYRKEATGNIDEVAIAKVIDAKELFDAITERQAFIVKEIESQGKLTDDLRASILSCFHKQRLEDLYLPFKQKKKSKAGKAREAGLQPLADWIWDCGHGLAQPEPGQTLEIWAFTFRNELKGYLDAQSVIDGAMDILVERMSEKQELREQVRSLIFNQGFIRTVKAEKSKPNSKFESYFDFQERISSLLKFEASHRYLALRRGWMEEELTLQVGGSKDDLEFESSLLKIFEDEACTEMNSPGTPVLLKAARLAFKAHVFPSIENEVHSTLKGSADEVAIDVFSQNVRKLLLSSPFGPKTVLGVDPGIRTGCKCAWVDDSGKYLASFVIHLQTDDGKKEAKLKIAQLLAAQNIQCIAVGNGTAGRETETFLRQAVLEAGHAVPVVMVNESGASVYSASDIAREEFPDLDITVRGAISIARRLQDPLAELVKIDPKSIGVGQYQHDVSQPALKRSLERVVDSCVNTVGVNLNTASKHLLAHVSGIGEGLAQAITDFRGKQGLFHSRSALLEVARFSQKVFEQAAGFLRISESENPLDRTGVHPENYAALHDFAQSIGKEVKDLIGSGVALVKNSRELREKLGEFTFADVVEELEKPGRDPRAEFVPFQYRADIHELKDLTPGMLCPGLVTNVTNFGAFVDIGVHQDGLVHISQLRDGFVKDPREVVSPGDRVQVKVLEVNIEKTQISLSMKVAERAEHVADSARGKKSRAPRGERPAKHPKPKREPSPPMERATTGSIMKSNAKVDRPPAAPSRPASPPQARGTKGGVKQPAAFNNPFAALANLKKGG